MAAKIFLDGSRDGEQAITLAAFAADEDSWGEFDEQWRSLLSSRRQAPYSHMKEVMPREGPFKQWDRDFRNSFVSALADLISEFRERPRFAAFSCTLDLNAHARWKRHRNLPVPARLCARLVFRHVLDWYGATFPDRDVIDVHFDRNEPFIGHVKNDWNSKKMRLRYPALRLIRDIGEADMQSVPALQAADMLAWSRNRLSVVPSGLSPVSLNPLHFITDEFSAIANHICTVINDSHIAVDEFALRTHLYPEH